MATHAEYQKMKDEVTALANDAANEKARSDLLAADKTKLTVDLEAAHAKISELEATAAAVAAAATGAIAVQADEVTDADIAVVTELATATRAMLAPAPTA